MQTIVLALLKRTGLKNNVTLVVDHRIQLLGRNAQEVADLVGERTEIPDMSYRNH